MYGSVSERVGRVCVCVVCDTLQKVGVHDLSTSVGHVQPLSSNVTTVVSFSVFFLVV
jgi:hypothetical protein